MERTIIWLKSPSTSGRQPVYRFTMHGRVELGTSKHKALRAGPGTTASRQSLWQEWRGRCAKEDHFPWLLLNTDCVLLHGIYFISGDRRWTLLGAETRKWISPRSTDAARQNQQQWREKSKGKANHKSALRLLADAVFCFCFCFVFFGILLFGLWLSKRSFIIYVTLTTVSIISVTLLVSRHSGLIQSHGHAIYQHQISHVQVLVSSKFLLLPLCGSNCEVRPFLFPLNNQLKVSLNFTL